MSYIGKSPSLKRTRYEPQSTDPVNPQDGDFFHSDGTPRAEGPWVYFNGTWQQVSTSGALATVNNLTFTPQAADPGSPVNGMVFYADGTSRTEGLWLYTDTGWHQLSGVRYQQYAVPDLFQVRSASTVNVTLASQVESGDSFGGVTLATGDFVLLKNQTTTTENGIYIVQVSGAPIRHVSFDSASELTYAAIRVMAGTNANTRWFQNNILSTLADPQSWSTSPNVYTFTVAPDVTSITIVGIGGGGGGQGGTRTNASNGTGGGGGGGSAPYSKVMSVVPGETFTVTLGAGGLGGVSTGGVGTNGAAGGITTVRRTSTNEVIFRAEGAVGGQPVSIGSSWTPSVQFIGGGNGVFAGSGNVGDEGFSANGGLGGIDTAGRGGGGGGGSGMNDGGNGGSTVTYIFTIPSSSIKAGTMYTNNGQTFRVSITTSNSTTLKCNGTGAPSASGTLTFLSGPTAGNLAFSAFTTSGTSTDRFGMAGTNGSGGGGGGGETTAGAAGAGGDGGYGCVEIYW